jgi:uroporphyrinogen decarboxylase
MSMNLFQAAIRRENRQRPPAWFMRQAGRYHSHYQALRAKYSFMELCKKPEIACEVTMGPIQDFGFDAAILFSDLLFPLEVMGMGLTYEPGPKLAWHLRDKQQLKNLQGGETLATQLSYQAEAMKLIRHELPTEKGLLGFVGGPLTLFCYAVEGSHQGRLDSAHEGLSDGRYDGFVERLLDLLAENMALQARAGADTVAVMDTCAGEFSPEVFARHCVPTLAILFEKFRKKCPDTPITYYSKRTTPAHWESLRELPIGAMGIDWNHDLAQVLKNWGDRFAIQGNIDPNWLFLETGELERRVRAVFEQVRALDDRCLDGWISGLGHGVMPGTPEASVRLVLQLQKEIFGGRDRS